MVHADQGLLEPARQVRKLPVVSEADLMRLIEAWERTRGPYEATDLVGAALVLDLPAHAIEPARYLLANEGLTNRLALRAATLIVDGHPTTSGGPLETVVPPAHRYLAIGKMKRRLREYPRNPYMWVDLALQYVNLGQTYQATAAFRVALALAPIDRFVRRVATRFLLHSDDPEKAHRLIRSSPSLTVDPWLLSAEISTATLRGVDSRFIRTGRRMIESGSFSPFHVSELAGSLATLEHKHGSHSKAKKLVRLSLVEPTDNSVAQAEWISRRSGSPYLGAPGSIEISSEAQAFRSLEEGRWWESTQECREWLSEEPFGSRPAVMGSFTSILDDDFKTSLWFAEQGLIANPFNQNLLNNKAFAQANLGDLAGASETLRTTSFVDASPRERVALKATAGFVAFREDLPDLGRQLYEQAVELAKSHEDPAQRVMALLNFAREEARIDRDRAARMLSELESDIARLDQTGSAIAERLRQSVEKLIED